jgi:hypothetical protein
LEGADEYDEHFERYSWGRYCCGSPDEVIATLVERVIGPAEPRYCWIMAGALLASHAIGDRHRS